MFFNEDVIVLVKVISDFVKDVEVFEIKGGLVDGKFILVEEINVFVKLLNKEGMFLMFFLVF